MTPLNCGNIIKTELRRCAKICQEHFSWASIKLDIRYDLRGTAAGSAHKDRRVRFNLLLLMEQTIHDVQQVAAHEFAHIVVYRRWQESHIPRTIEQPVYDEAAFVAAADDIPSPHGQEWRRTMHLFGFYPQRCHKFDITKHRRR